jgi:hypothetical protein
MSPRAKRPRNPTKPVKPIKPIPGKPVIPQPVVKYYRSPIHFQTTILHSMDLGLYEAIENGVYSASSKENVELGVSVLTGLSLPPKLKLRYVSFYYQTQGESYIRMVTVSKVKEMSGLSIFNSQEIHLQSSERAEYKTDFLEQALSETDGAINLILSLRFPNKDERITIGTIIIEANEVTE